MREPALIFDFGNVVGFFDYLKVCERLGPRLGLTAEAFRRHILERGFSPLLGRFESGKIGPEEFAEAVMALSGVRLPYEDFVDGGKTSSGWNGRGSRPADRAAQSDG